MSIPFPLIEPTKFSFTMPRHPMTSSTSENGMEDHRIWGTVATSGMLDLEFNISFTKATLILNTFHESYSGILPLELPDVLFAGVTHEDREFINSVTTAAGLQWFWPVGQDAPTPRAGLVFRNRCTLPVQLHARLGNGPRH